MTSTDAVAPSRPLRKDAVRNRELLIAAAREVFAQRGLEASMDDIARQAGLGVGTAYRHFANKYELATAIFEQSIDGVVGFAERALDATDPWQGLVSFLESLLEAQTADRGLREILMGAHDSKDMEQVHDRLIGPFSQIVERARQSGALRPDVQPTDLGVVTMMLCQAADLAGAESPQLWRRYLAVVLDGLRAGASADPLPIAPLSENAFRSAMAAHKQMLVREQRSGN